MSRPIHLTPPEKERSPDWGRQVWMGRGTEGESRTEDGDWLQRLHVASAHYAAFRRRAVWRQQGLGSPQTGSGATMPIAKRGPAMPLSRCY